MATAFFKKYPDADPNRFVFKNEKVWFKINPDNENRLLDIESDTYQRTSAWTKRLSHKLQRARIWNMVCGWYCSTLQEKYNLGKRQ